MSATGETQPDSATRKWVCSTCGFVYDPAEGDEDGGIPLGTAFEDIPEDWICPVCGARKRDFRPMEAGEELS